MNEIGKIIEVNPILKKHYSEIGSGTQGKICEYLECKKGEVCLLFDDIENMQQGQLCKIKEDVVNGFSLAAFDQTDDKDLDTFDKDYWNNRGSDGNAIRYIDKYKYIMRLH